MNLKELLNQDKIKHHKTSKEEINNLLILIKRDIKDAKVEGLSSDRKFATAYNAVLQTATIFLHCKGYKTKGAGHHFTVFQAVKNILNKKYYDLVDYFDSCRAKRNITDYTYAGNVSESEAQELVVEAEKFLKVVLDWLKKHYSELLGNNYAKK